MGKEGRAHQAECRDYKLGYNWGIPDLCKGWKMLVCLVCGKELAHYCPPTSTATLIGKPGWVTE